MPKPALQHYDEAPPLPEGFPIRVRLDAPSRPPAPWGWTWSDLPNVNQAVLLPTPLYRQSGPRPTYGLGQSLADVATTLPGATVQTVAGWFSSAAGSAAKGLGFDPKVARIGLLAGAALLTLLLLTRK